MKMFSYLYKVSSKLIGDERYSVLDITKKSSLNYRNILYIVSLWYIVHTRRIWWLNKLRK